MLHDLRHGAGEGEHRRRRWTFFDDAILRQRATGVSGQAVPAALRLLAAATTFADDSREVQLDLEAAVVSNWMLVNDRRETVAYQLPAVDCDRRARLEVR